MFENIHFNGKFRDYQQRVIDGADKYLSDGKIHIVAAPGSGKTILGLELIRRLNAPCIILSPTTTIRNQWSERFTENFLDGIADNKYLSFDLNKLAPLTVVTYQALHAAMKRLRDTEDNTDYSTLDLISETKKFGIKTICLDEAHHLQNEWQKELENFISALNGDIKIIALTATPPYDASPSEWKRYVNICGEIDEEIFVPELVKQGTLCPHQDYIYFNYPTDAETESFSRYREHASTAIKELFSSGFIDKAYTRLIEYQDDYEFLYDNTKEIIALLSLCSVAGIRVNKQMLRTITASRRQPPPTNDRLSVAVNFLIKGPLLTDSERKELLEIFKRHGVYERGKVSLGLDEKNKKRLISSVGKLSSIKKIAESEKNNKGDSLRLLVLTDFIRKESLSAIGTAITHTEVSVVSVFDTIRKTDAAVGALSGSVVILPDFCAEFIAGYNVEFSLTPINNTGYSVYDFHTDNKLKVKIVSKLFEEGKINALVGTKSLLGEGWDAPCVNSLILASFVGSFMLSNQMRGRAIRTYKNDPNKTANIWHLVTVERPKLYTDNVIQKLMNAADDNKNELLSYDWDVVSRRFDCFVAPNYDTGEIECGISRITTVRPPYDEAGINRINAETIKRSQNSNALAEVWQTALNKSTRLNEVSDIPKDKKVPPFLFVNIAKASAIFSLFTMALSIFISTLLRLIRVDDVARALIILASLVVCIFSANLFCNILIKKILTHINPVRSIRTFAECILKAMIELNIVSEGTRVKVYSDEYGICIHTELLNASVHDQNLFHKAVKELLSPIENPRYLLIPRGVFGNYKYENALACPEILGSRNEYAQCLAKKLKHSLSKIETVYTRTADGRKLILKCRKASYITRNESALYGVRKRISNWE